jgi:hypothetical protein
MKECLSSASAGGNASAVKIWLEILERRGIGTRLRKTCDDELDYEVNQLFESVAHFCNFESFNVLLEQMNVELCPSSLTHQQMLCNFVRSGETGVVRLFLDRGFDVNAMHCDEQGNKGVINMLLDRGANPIFGLGEMITPLEMAAREFQSDLLRNFWI